VFRCSDRNWHLNWQLFVVLCCLWEDGRGMCFYECLCTHYLLTLKLEYSGCLFFYWCVNPLLLWICYLSFSQMFAHLVYLWQERQTYQTHFPSSYAEVMTRKSLSLLSVNCLMTLYCSFRQSGFADDRECTVWVHWLGWWNGSSINMPVKAWFISVVQMLSVHSSWSPERFVYHSVSAANPI